MKKIVLPLLIGMAFVAGCKTTEPPPAGVLFINQKQLGKMIVVDQVHSEATATGTRKVWTSIRNVTQSRAVLEVRAVFLGVNGEPIESPTAWRSLFIEANTSTVFDAMSMSDRVKQATIEIKVGNR
jgi:hypothetical protein